MERLKIFFIAPANNIHTIRWVNELSKKIEVHLISCSNHFDGQDKIDEKVIVHKLKIKAPLGYYINALELRKLYQKIKPDLINVHYASGYGTLARIAKIKPILLSIWGSDVYDFPNESKIKNKIFKKNILNAEGITSTSKAMAKELEKTIDLKEKTIEIVPFGVDTDKFKKIEIKKENKEFKIGNIKALEKKYGIEYAILAVKQLKEKLINNNEKELAETIKLYIYGKGTQKEQLEKLIQEEKLEETVYLMGRIPNEEVPETLNKLDIFCATSILDSESFGVAVVEAMSCEIPVVATNVDGFCEVMEDGKTGIIVERKNINEIAQAIEELLRDKEKRKNYGKEGRRRVLEKYNWKENVETMINTYKKIVNKD